jgi:hypothetical protein
MAPRLRLHPAVVFVLVGASFVLGTASTLPLWRVPEPTTVLPGGEGDYDLRRGTLWEAAAGTATLAQAFPHDWQLLNLALAIYLLAAGMAAGRLYYAGVWEPLRAALHRPPPGAEPPWW